MRIITYNPDGTIKTVTDYAVALPSYIVNYDDNISFLNITEDDINTIRYGPKNSKSVRLLLDYYYALVKHDYMNFIDSCHNPLHDGIDAFISKCNSNNAIMYKSKVLKSFVNKKWDYLSPIPNFIAFAEESNAEEQWIDVLLYTVISRASKKHKHPTPEDIVASWYSFLHKYYYALKLYWRQCDLMDILEPFANYTLRRPPSTFWRKILFALFKQESKRSYLYTLLYLNDCVMDYSYCPSSFLHMLIEPIPQKKKEEDLYWFKFTDCKGNDCIKFALTDGEMTTLKVNCPEADALVEKIAPLLDHLNKEYESFLGFLWKHELRSMSLRFQSEDILYETLRNKYQQEYDKESGSYHPQTCFRYIVTITDVKKDVPVMFGRELIALLLLMLSVNKAENIIGLFESKFKINYIKCLMANKGTNGSADIIVMSDEENQRLNRTIAAVHTFLNPILLKTTNMFINKEVIDSDDTFLSTIDNILRHNDIRRELMNQKNYISNISPFFNGKLLLNILGALCNNSSPKYSWEENQHLLNSRQKKNANAAQYIRSLIGEDNVENYSKHISQFDSSNRKISLLTPKTIETIRAIVKQSITTH